MDKQVIRLADRPAGSAPLSPGIRYGDFLFVSGQVAADPRTGKPVEGGIEPQARQVLENLKAVLEAGGSSLDRVLKTTCFLTSMDDFAAFNGVYRQFFPNDPPARSTFQVGGLAPGYVVEIEAIATVGS